jgi:hypothetical protein
MQAFAVAAALVEPTVGMVHVTGRGRFCRT